jgi:hypothetical protein
VPTHAADKMDFRKIEGVPIPLTPTDRNRLFEVDGVLLPLARQTEMDFWKIEGVLSGSEGEQLRIPFSCSRLLCKSVNQEP